MTDIQRIVRRVWRRLMWQRFLGILGWSLVAGLLVGGLGALASKIWLLPVPVESWVTVWLAAGVLLGLIVAGVVTWWKRVSLLDAALAIDHRYGLYERISSCLAMSADECQSPAGQALLDDACRRIQRLDVAEQFRIRAPVSLTVPLPLAALLALGLWFIPDAQARNRAIQPEHEATAKKVQQQVKRMEAQLRQQRNQLSEEALQEAQQLFRDLQRSLEELQQKPISDRKQALAELRDLADKVDQKRRELGGVEQLRQQLRELKGLSTGPAEQFAESLKQGNFAKAMDALEQLKQKLQSNTLSESEKAELAKQFESLQQRLQQMQQEYESAKRELERQIAAAQQAGNLEAVNRLQQKLSQLDGMRSQVNRLGQLANALGECSQCLQQGDARQAIAQMQQAASQLSQLQGEMEALQACEALLEDLADIREDLASGDQMPSSLGMSALDSDSLQTGRGLGRGRGEGDRPERATDTQAYETRVAGKLRQGKAVITGSVGGPNLTGQSVASVKEAIAADFRDQTDPVEDEKLPRDQREHIKEYFQKYVKP